MTAYRNDYDAAVLLNSHLERDVKDLLKENDELKARNLSLAVIARGLMDTEPCMRLSKVIGDLETENTLLSMEKAMLEQEPQHELLDEIDRLVEMQRDAMWRIRRTRQLAYVLFSVGMAIIGALQLFL